MVAKIINERLIFIHKLYFHLALTSRLCLPFVWTIKFILNQFKSTARDSHFTSFTIAFHATCKLHGVTPNVESELFYPYYSYHHVASNLFPKSSNLFSHSSGTFPNSSGTFSNSSGTFSNSSGTFSNSSGTFSNSSGRIGESSRRMREMVGTMGFKVRGIDF